MSSFVPPVVRSIKTVKDKETLSIRYLWYLWIFVEPMNILVHVIHVIFLEPVVPVNNLEPVNMLIFV